MAIRVETSDAADIHAGGGNWLTAETGRGTHHCACIDAVESPTDKDGKAMDAEARFTLQILASTNPAAVGKQWDMIAWTPKLNDKDGGKLARRRNTAMYLGLGVISPADCGKSSVEIDPAKGKTRQCIVTLDTYKDSAGKEKLSIHFDSVFHLDDPAAKDFPRDAKALALVPKDHRLDPASFKREPVAGANSNGQRPAPSQPEFDLSQL